MGSTYSGMNVKTKYIHRIQYNPSDVKEKISLQKISTTVWKDNITMDSTKTVCYDGLESFASEDQVTGSCDHINENRAMVERHTTRCRQ